MVGTPIQPIQWNTLRQWLGRTLETLQVHVLKKSAANLNFRAPHTKRTPKPLVFSLVVAMFERT